ncbi:hypothetical protein GCM10023346_47810 [Arthrobacter gyeryongensis]|uniref:Uncharacterized protein n=1 Tax=Arthrobacter gyeryongensis TaxID=1650592 RepID=A0ABP9SVC5_9MICC
MDQSDYYGFSVGDYIDPTFGQLAREYYLSALAELRPLADVGAIEWFDVSHQASDNGALGRKQAVRADRRNLALEFDGFPFDLTGLQHLSDETRVIYRSILEGRGHTWEQFLVEVVYDELAVLSPSFLGFGQPYFRYPIVEQVVTALLSKGAFRRDLPFTRSYSKMDVDDLYMRRLITLQMPSFDDLDVPTMAQLRTSEGGIERWRVGLRKALSSAMSAPSNSTMDTVQRHFEENMLEECRILQDKTKRGSIGTFGSAALRSITFGFVGGIAGASIGGDLRTSTASGMASGVTRAVYEWQAARRADRTDRLLLAHYGIARPRAL